jgi:Protein phosphatase 2C
MEFSNENGMKIIRTNQSKEAFIRYAFQSHMAMRLLYMRCRETQANQSKGQDYALVSYDSQQARVYFCVCDGVGSSYAAEFAAYYLAQYMIQLLPKVPEEPVNMKALEEWFTTALNNGAQHAHRHLLSRKDHQSSDALVREVLDELRTTYGSETVFWGGRLSLQNRENEQALFCWMGNVSAIVATHDHQEVSLNDDQNDANRWSTGRGVRGKINIRCVPMTYIKRLLIFTDGLASLYPGLSSLTDSALQERCKELLERPESDDMTFLDFVWPAQSAIGEKGF